MLKKDIKMENITNSEIEHVAKAAAVRLQTNNLKMQGLSNSQAKTAAASAMATQEMLDEAEFALKAGLGGESISFITAVGSREEKLLIFLDRKMVRAVAESVKKSEAEHFAAEVIRKSKRIQIDGLKGTNKQVSWALTIRQKVILQHGEGKKDFEELVLKIKSAKWWIENRNLQSRLPFYGVSVREYFEQQFSHQNKSISKL